MQLRITALLCLLAVAVHAEGLRNRFGVFTNGQTLATGRVAVSTNAPISFYVGNATSNAVKVGVESVAATNTVFPRLWLATNAWIQVATDGTNLLWIVNTNGTLNVSNQVTTTVVP